MFGGESSKRKTLDLAKIAAIIFEAVGLLNKGSADAPAAPGPGESNDVQPVSSNALNVTRVGGVATLIGGAGAAALTIFGVDKKTDPHSIVVVAYASVGVIVTGALLAVAIIIAADIRARATIATATSADASQARIDVKSVQGPTKTSLDRAYEYVLLDAGEGDIGLTLPSAGSCAWQQLTLKRTDGGDPHGARIHDPVSASHWDLSQRHAILQLYSDGKAWTAL